MSGEHACVLRGGSFYNVRAVARCSYRSYYHPDDGNCKVGFHVSRTPSP